MSPGRALHTFWCSIPRHIVSENASILNRGDARLERQMQVTDDVSCSASHVSRSAYETSCYFLIIPAHRIDPAKLYYCSARLQLWNDNCKHGPRIIWSALLFVGLTRRMVRDEVQQRARCTQPMRRPIYGGARLTCVEKSLGRASRSRHWWLHVVRLYDTRSQAVEWRGALSVSKHKVFGTKYGLLNSGGNSGKCHRPSCVSPIACSKGMAGNIPSDLF